MTIVHLPLRRISTYVWVFASEAWQFCTLAVLPLLKVGKRLFTALLGKISNYIVQGPMQWAHSEAKNYQTLRPVRSQRMQK